MSNKEKIICRSFVHEQETTSLLVDKLKNVFKKAAKKYEGIIIVCIGTDRSAGDSLGPFVGTYLTKKLNKNFIVLGTLNEPVNAVNLAEVKSYIQETYPNHFMLAVDSSLGDANKVGAITLCKGPLNPGSGVGKELPEMGTYSMTGCVNVGGFLEYFVLQNTRLSLVVNMAEIISSSIIQAGRYIRFKNEKIIELPLSEMLMKDA